MYQTLHWLVLANIHQRSLPPVSLSTTYSPLPSTIVSSDLSYDLTSSLASSLPSFHPGDMVLARGHVVHILSSSYNPETTIVSYAIETSTHEVFITTADTIMPIPTLPDATVPPPKSHATPSTSLSSKSSFSHHHHCSIHSSHSHCSHHSSHQSSVRRVLPFMVASPPVSEISISDYISLSSTIKTHKSYASPIEMITTMRREFQIELQNIKEK